MVESADQSLRELERRARHSPENSELQQSLALRYLRQNRLSPAIQILQNAELFAPNVPAAQSIASELKRIQKATLPRLHSETRVWSWPQSSKPETLIPIKEWSDASPVILGLLFREKDWSILRSAPDVKLWLQSLSITRADHYSLPLINWILSLPHLWQLSIQLAELQKKRSKALSKLSQLRDLRLFIDGPISDHFFQEIVTLDRLRAFTFHGSLLKFNALPLQNLIRLKSLTLAPHRPLSNQFIFRLPKQLEELTIHVPTLSKHTVQSLASLSLLRTLELTGLTTPQDLSFMENYRQLQSLSLSPTLFIESVERLPHPERLQSLTLTPEINPPPLLHHLNALQGLRTLTIKKNLLNSSELIQLKELCPLLTDISIR